MDYTIFMRTIKIDRYDISKTGASNDFYSNIDWYIDMDVVGEVIDPNQEILGEGDLLLDLIEDDIFILIPGGIYITSCRWNTMPDEALSIEGFCESNPEIMKDDDQLVKELI